MMKFVTNTEEYVQNWRDLFSECKEGIKQCWIYGNIVAILFIILLFPVAALLTLLGLRPDIGGE